MIEDILQQGLNLMAFGMGTVFAFLTTLVIMTSIMSAIVGKFFVAPPPEPEPSASPEQKKDDHPLVSAIIAAIKFHRSRRNQ